MTIRQPANLNHFVLPTVGQRRARLYGLIAPLACFSTICGFEISLCADFKNGLPLNMGKAVLVAVVTAMIHVAIVEIGIWCMTRRVRTLTVGKDGLDMAPSKEVHWDWDLVHRIDLEPIEGIAGMTKVTILRGSKPEVRREKTWSIVLDSKFARDELGSLLTQLRTNGALASCIVQAHDLPQPSLPWGPRVSAWFYVAGLWLFMHGFVLVGIGISNLKDESRWEERLLAHKKRVLAKQEELRKSGVPPDQLKGLKAVLDSSLAEREAQTTVGLSVIAIVGGLVLLFGSAGCFIFHVIWHRQNELAWKLEQAARSPPSSD